jgi:hypothetical protein
MAGITGVAFTRPVGTLDAILANGSPGWQSTCAR